MFFFFFLRLCGGNLEMLQVRVLELGSICLETSTKDQCEKYTFKHEITTAREIRVDSHKPELME